MSESRVSLDFGSPLAGAALKSEMTYERDRWWDQHWESLERSKMVNPTRDDIDKPGARLDSTVLSEAASALNQLQLRKTRETVQAGEGRKAYPRASQFKQDAGSSRRKALQTLESGNGVTKKTTPGLNKRSVASTQKNKLDARNVNSIFAPSSSSGPWSKDRVERIAKALPEGWVMLMSRSQGKPFYCRPATGEKTWLCPIPLDATGAPIVEPVAPKKSVLLCGECDVELSGEIRTTFTEKEGVGYRCSKCDGFKPCGKNKEPLILCQDCAFQWGKFCAGMMCNKFYCSHCPQDWLGDLNGGDEYCGRTCMGKWHPDYKRFSRHRVAFNADSSDDEEDAYNRSMGYRQCKGITKEGHRCRIMCYHNLEAACPLQDGDDFCAHHGGKVKYSFGCSLEDY